MKRIFTAIIALFSIGWLAAQIVVRTETGIYFLPIASVDSVTFMSHPKRYEFFSVGAGKYVAFSPGNLQYSGVKSGNYRWSFAAHQYDCIGAANVDNGALADKIDLFGWSANNTTAPWGISMSTTAGEYSGDFVDWGTNAIGQDAANTWRTLSQEEWAYLFNSRTDASSKYGVARINLNADGSKYMNGLIVLPDTWTCPSGITFKGGVSTISGGYADYQTFTLSQWEQLEQSGAVFLPAAGNRRDSYVFNVQDYGRYWSSTASGTDHAYNVSFRSDILSLQGHTARNYGQAVRLVQDLKRYAITCATVDHAVITTDKTTASAGQTITITITPEAKYFTGTVTCTMTDGTAVAVNASTPKSNTYTFTMPAGNVTISATITRGFSVSADRFVEFAEGNLQYQPSTKTFRLAPHQYDTIGADNAQYLPKTSSSYSGWIDVFAWGTGDRPTVFGQTKTYPTFVDWGSNAIGTYAPNTWRTPTKDEWNYLLVKRPDAGDLMAFCTVNNVKGLIVLPDNWVTPVGLSFTPSVEKGLSYKTLEEGGEILEVYLDEDGDQKGYDHSTDNIYTLAEWSQLEAAGAVFLPADGMFSESHFDRGFGQYWSATPERTDEAYSSVFCGEVGNTMLVPFIYQDSRRYDMRTVRFVQDRNEYAITSVQKHAFFTVERTHANEGDVTTFTATPEMGYAITSVTITEADGSTITPTANATANQYTFTMPASNVTISATCELQIYTITCNTPTNGTLIADKATSTMGETVTITAKPDEGYALQLTVQQGTTKVGTTFLGSNTYTFTMPAGDVVVSAVFQKIRYSVSDNEDVAFSRGNLQYTQSTKTWSFAEHQYDYIGAGNVENGALADKIDLFGWSADNTTAPWGISTSTNKSDYSGDFVDWGENAIGQDAANTWRTLSGEEWGYLFESRANASSLYGFATVDGKKGLILLPDDWVLPSGISFHAGKANFGNNDYTLVQWEEMESAGAVFLPGAGRRKGTDYDVQGYNVYWSSTACNANNENDPYNANFVLFHSNNGNQVEPRYCDIRYYGRSVRLVKDL